MLPVAWMFDLDGTLVDTIETRIAAWRRAFEEFGVPVERVAVAKLIGSDGRRLARVVAEAAGQVLDPGRDEEIDRRAGDIYSGLNTNPRVLPGALELLTALDEGGLKWAIATSSRREQVDKSVQALALAGRPIIIDGSNVEHAKPAPDLLLFTARELGVEPSLIYFVCFSPWYMLSTHSAGTWSRVVATGSASAT